MIVSERYGVQSLGGRLALAGGVDAVLWSGLGV